jgi:hypothetical protein
MFALEMLCSDREMTVGVTMGRLSCEIAFRLGGNDNAFTYKTVSEKPSRKTPGSARPACQPETVRQNRKKRLRLVDEKPFFMSHVNSNEQFQVPPRCPRPENHAYRYLLSRMVSRTRKTIPWGMSQSINDFRYRH